MATITSFLTGVQEVESTDDRIVSVKNTLDFSSTNVSAADVVQALKIPANSIVLGGVQTDVQTAEGGTATANIGDASDVSGYDAGVNFNSATTTVVNSTREADNYSEGRVYDAADTIDIIPANNLDAAIVQVSCMYRRIA